MKRPDIYMGFELEGLIHRDYVSEFIDGLGVLHKSVCTTNDSSIDVDNDNQQDIEIITPKLPEKKALSLLDEILSYLYICSQAGIFKTNRTCGFHLNISEKDTFKNTQEKENIY